MSRACGWDIGGVHLKAASCDGASGAGMTWRVVPFEIWRQPERLADRLRSIASDLGAGGGDAHAVTMTAELSDVFQDRATGVRAILTAVRASLGPRARVLDLEGRLVPIEAAEERPGRIAAFNWLATAMLAARHAGDGLLIDVGSTTTDIVPLRNGRPAPRAHTDLDRLAIGELVYTGFLRTPPAALTDSVPVRGRPCRVAPEHFTIMADAYVLLGRLRPEDYTVETPDGRGRTRDECMTRLARLVCSDPATLGAATLRAMALHLEERQIAQLTAVVAEVARWSETGRTAIVAGAGASLAAAAARLAGLQPARLAEVLPLGETETPAAPWDVAAPAVALALMAGAETA
jgi:(4-(4-[2-(gamma-L-glutamylamino)ethyl]phenoxymethyl)furan-2-yl)methanamine synthase